MTSLLPPRKHTGSDNVMSEAEAGAAVALHQTSGRNNESDRTQSKRQQPVVMTRGEQRASAFGANEQPELGANYAPPSHDQPPRSRFVTIGAQRDGASSDITLPNHSHSMDRSNGQGNDDYSDDEKWERESSTRYFLSSPHPDEVPIHNDGEYHRSHISDVEQDDDVITPEDSVSAASHHEPGIVHPPSNTTTNRTKLLEDRVVMVDDTIKQLSILVRETLSRVERLELERAEAAENLQNANDHDTVENHSEKFQSCNQGPDQVVNENPVPTVGLRKISYSHENNAGNVTRPENAKATNKELLPLPDNHTQRQYMPDPRPNENPSQTRITEMHSISEPMKSNPGHSQWAHEPWDHPVKPRAREPPQSRGDGRQWDTIRRRNTPELGRNNDHPYHRIQDRESRPHEYGRRAPDRRSRSRSDSPENGYGSYHKHKLLPEKFNGSTSVDSFFAQYDSCAKYNGWGERDKVAYLRWSLTGPAAQLLWDGGFSDNLTYDELSQKVRQRFGSAGQEERYQGELRARKRKRGEQLQVLYHDIRRLMSLAYPGEISRFSELIAKDAFLSALDDNHLELRCREHEPKDLDTALRIAMRLEQNEKAVNTPHANPHINRQAHIREDTVPDSRLTDLERKLRSEYITRQQQRDELARQLSDLKREVDEINKVGNQSRLEEAGPQCGYPPQRPIPPASQYRPHTITCFRCGQAGHVMRYCISRGVQNITDQSENSNNQATVHSNPAVDKHARNQSLSSTSNSERVYLRVGINYAEHECLLDSGSAFTVFPAQLIPAYLLHPTSQRLSTVNGATLELTGEVDMLCDFGGNVHEVHGVVSPEINEVILGQDFLAKQQAQWDFKQSTLKLLGQTFPLHAAENTRLCRMVTPYRSIVQFVQSEEIDVADCQTSGYDQTRDPITPTTALYVENNSVKSETIVEHMPAKSKCITRYLDDITIHYSTLKSRQFPWRLPKTRPTHIPSAHVRKSYRNGDASNGRRGPPKIGYPYGSYRRQSTENSITPEFNRQDNSKLCPCPDSSGVPQCASVIDRRGSRWPGNRAVWNDGVRLKDGLLAE